MIKLLFWNIGSDQTTKKLELLEDLSNEIKPNFLCIAEGTPSKASCYYLDKYCKTLGYNKYYSPIDTDNHINYLPYNYDPYGLKIYFSKNTNLESDFSYSMQKIDGRVVCTKIKLNDKYFDIYFVHLKSKLSHKIDQVTAISELSMFVNGRIRLNPNVNPIIIGDFNCEPWDELLSMKKYIRSYFYLKEYDFYNKKKQNLLFYYNPIFEYIRNHEDANLIGTFYNGSHISILDFALISALIKVQCSLEIITSINSNKLIQENNTKTILKHDFDHLPILLTIQ